jgi:ubiquinone/menaquinone biosynthesis C-methylase UbiE
MENVRADVEKHYGRGEILNSILHALRDAGKDLTQLTPPDLAPVDEFHIRGREATIELANRVSLQPGLHALDVGCGLGGSARYLASEHGCYVTGIDLTKEYVEVATALADLVGLKNRVEFQQSSALSMPFDNNSFDLAWTEHVQMNIADKRAFYGEIARVLKPGGRLLFHDIFQGDGGPPHYPVPWAETSEISFLATPETVRGVLNTLGFKLLSWENKSQHSLEWFAATLERIKQSGPPLLGLHLLMGVTVKAKFENVLRNLQEGRIVVFQAAAEKS